MHFLPAVILMVPGPTVRLRVRAAERLSGGSPGAFARRRHLNNTIMLIQTY